MVSLKIALTAFALAVATPANAEAVQRWRPHIEESTARFGVPVEWIERVMRSESGGHTTLAGRPIVSRAGAMGLMQLMPGTWREMRARLALGPDPHDPRDNILAGTAYLRLMYDRFGYPGLFAAYNAGPARYAAHLAGGRPLPRETVAYLAAVAGPAGALPSPSELPLARTAPALFALRVEAGTAPRASAGPLLLEPAGAGLFAIRRPLP